MLHPLGIPNPIYTGIVDNARPNLYVNKDIFYLFSRAGTWVRNASPAASVFREGRRMSGIRFTKNAPSQRLHVHASESGL